MSIHLTNPYLPLEHQFVDPQNPISTNLGEFLRAFGFEFRIRGKGIAHFTQHLGTQKYNNIQRAFSRILLAGNISLF